MWLDLQTNANNSYLQDYPLVDGELGNDVREQEVSVVAGGRVDADLEQEAGPRVRHEPA